MPLTLKSPFAFLGRRRTSTEDDTRSSPSSAGATNQGGGATTSRNGSTTPSTRQSGSTRTDSLGPAGTAGGSQSSKKRPGGDFLKVTVPDSAKPGEATQVRAPDGRLIEIQLPPNCKPGQRITIQIDGIKQAGAASSMQELSTIVKGTLEATRVSINSLRERLREELELQRGLWASTSVAQQSYGQRQTYGQDHLMLVPTGPLEELSQTQALVFAAAEAGDPKQLLAALHEARQFSSVSLSLEQCVNSLNTAEEAMVTYRCLLEAMQAENRHEMEVWIEQARASNLEVPDFTAALEILRRREQDSLQHFAKLREVEQRLQFALEAADLDLLKEVVAEADSVGLHSKVAVEAANRLRNLDNSPGRRTKSPARSSKPAAGSGTSTSSDAPRAPCWRPAPSDASGRREESPTPMLFPKVEPEDPFSPGWRSKDEARSKEEAGVSYSHSRPSASYSGTSQVPDSDPRSVKELLEECRRYGIDTSGCTDKQDLLRLLVNRPKVWAGETTGFGASGAPSGPSKEKPRVHASQSATPSGAAGPTPQTRSGSSAPSGPGAPLDPPRAPAYVAPSYNSSSFARPSSAPQSGPKTVWDRRYPPPHLLTKRSKSLWLLGLDPYASPTSADLRTAYRKAAMDSHPDRQQNHAREAQAKELFQQVKDAFDHLSKG